MQKETINILEEETDIGLNVTFTKSYERQIEEGHGLHDLSGYNYDIHSIELVIAGKCIDITKSLSKEQFLCLQEKTTLSA